MKKVILFSTSYPYTTGIIAVMWLGAVILLKIDGSLASSPVILWNVVLTLLVASIGFRR